jgi:hypothetical protein
MIDENSHCSQTTTKVAARTICFLSENVHPSKVFVTSTGIASSFSSQEPRRPRFSFFYLHNVKEPTQQTPRRTRNQSLSKKFHKEQQLISGCPAATLPCQEKRQSVGATKARVVNVRWIYESQNRLSTPFSETSQTIKTESLFFPETHQRSFPTPPVVCSITRCLAAPRSAAVSGVLRRSAASVNSTK